MQTRQSLWTLLLAALTAPGAQAAVEGEFRLGALAGIADWDMALEFSGQHVYGQHFQPSHDKSTAVVGQYFVGFDVDKPRIFGGVEVEARIDSEVADHESRPFMPVVVDNPDDPIDPIWLFVGMTASKVADVVLLGGFDFGWARAFAGAGVSRANVQARYEKWDFDVPGKPEGHVEGPQWGFRHDVGIEVDIGRSLVLQIRASQTDYGNRMHNGTPESPIADLESSEYLATLLYRF